jgi:hypothetical protein
MNRRVARSLFDLRKRSRGCRKNVDEDPTRLEEFICAGGMEDLEYVAGIQDRLLSPKTHATRARPCARAASNLASSVLSFFILCFELRKIWVALQIVEAVNLEPPAL